MKRLRIGFLAIVGILAITLTAASSSDILEKVKPTNQYLCKKSQDFTAAQIKDPSDCNTSLIRLNDQYHNPSDPSEILCPGEELDFYCASGTINLAPSDFECTNGTEEFCCAQLLETAACCNFTKKVKIWCKDSD